MAKWIGELMYITTHTRVDIAYATMRLSGYMSAPKAPAFKALHWLMAYLYHHPHMPLMYSSTSMAVFILRLRSVEVRSRSTLREKTPHQIFIKRQRQLTTLNFATIITSFALTTFNSSPAPTNYLRCILN